MTTPKSEQGKLPPMGYGGLTFRNGKKPVIAAVNGLAVGGGTEMVMSCDIVIAAENATLALPDVKVGLTELGGILPRLVRTIGYQRAAEMTLTGRAVSVEEAREWGLVNKVVEDGKVVDEAVEVARRIRGNGPNAVVATREGLRMGLEGGGVLEKGREFVGLWRGRLVEGEELEVGIRAFRERRKPNWKAGRL
jgi:enoyl-CoA hydratase/carnithine racemase